MMNDCDNGGKPDPYCPENLVPHKVEITYDYFIMQSEVTRGLYKDIMKTDPSFFASGQTKNCTNCPVESVTWIDALRFANELSKSEGFEECYTISETSIKWKGLECKGWRLPTEAEWERAAKSDQNIAMQDLMSANKLVGLKKIRICLTVLVLSLILNAPNRRTAGTSVI